MTVSIKLNELLKVFDAPFTIESSKETYDSGSIIPEELMDSTVTSIKMKKNGIVIFLDESKKLKTLEDLGYSFEVGV